MTQLDFNAFFQAIHEVSPLPWQSDLAKRLLVNNSWPDLIDLPTASGKTACIDIAVFHLAACAERGRPWEAARRIVFVVDRRIIVDAAADRAEKIGKALKESKEPAVVTVASALSRLGGESPLCCQKLRGGMPRERGFALDPAQPMIITSTVDQVGSRLLFRGYGLSPYSQPLHAGLLSHDTLILLDEAHLGEPFIETVKSIRREQARAQRPFKFVQPVRLVPLSATAQTDGERFQLSAADLKNKFLDERRTAPKPARLMQTSTKPAEHLKLLLDESLNLYKNVEDSAPTVAVIVNRVKTARDLFDALRQKSPKDVDVELMIGRSRPLDREEIAKRLLRRVAANRKPISDERGLIVVATQTIEVGADFDFHGMVTECASLDALRQRFGRVDRLGRFRRSSSVILGGSDTDDDPIYGAALNRTWQWINRIAVKEDAFPTVNFSIEAMEFATKDIDVRELNSDLRERLCLTPSHVQLLCQTAPAPMYQPDINALLHGLKTEQPDVQVIWRDHVPVTGNQESLDIDSRENEFVNAMLGLNPPTSIETIGLPLYSVKAWLTGQAAARELGDLEGVSPDEEETKSSRGALLRSVWRWEGDSRQSVEYREGQERHVQGGWQVALAASLRAGDTIVVPSVYGGCDDFGFAPTSQALVSDLSEKARELLERERIVLVTQEYLRRRLDPIWSEGVTAIWGTIQEAYRSQEFTPPDLLSMLLEKIEIATSMELALIEQPVVEPLLRSNGSLYALILRTGNAGTEDISDEDLSSSFTVPVLLDKHNLGVGKRARSLARSVGLESDLIESVGCGGDVHDLGKADPRFQRLLRAGNDATSPGELLAKGLRRRQSRRVELGERHEAYSVAMLKAFPNLLMSASDAELALYLVGTHHGRGRAVMPFKDDDGCRFSVRAANGEVLEYEGTPQLGKLGSGWPTLFWNLVQRYGAWGLAYLESILRLADHLQSRDEMARKKLR